MQETPLSVATKLPGDARPPEVRPHDEVVGSLRRMVGHLNTINTFPGALEAITQQLNAETPDEAPFRFGTDETGQVDGFFFEGYEDETVVFEDMVAALRKTGAISQEYMESLTYTYEAVIRGLNPLQQILSQGGRVDRELFNAYCSALDSIHTLFRAGGNDGLRAIADSREQELTKLRLSILGGADQGKTIADLQRKLGEAQQARDEAQAAQARSDLAATAGKEATRAPEAGVHTQFLGYVNLAVKGDLTVTQIAEMKKAGGFPVGFTDVDIAVIEDVAKEQAGHQHDRKAASDYLGNILNLSNTLSALEQALLNRDPSKIPDSDAKLRTQLSELIDGIKQQGITEGTRATETRMVGEIQESQSARQRMQNQIDRLSRQLEKRPTEEQLTAAYEMMQELRQEIVRLQGAQAVQPAPEQVPEPPARPVVSSAEAIGVLTAQEVADLRQEYDRLVRECLGEIPPNAFEGQVPNRDSKVGLIANSRVDALASTENDPSWSPNKQFGIFRLLDAEFGGVMAVFKAGIKTVGERQLQGYSAEGEFTGMNWEDDRARSEAIAVLAEDGQTRDRLSTLLSQKCVMGYEYQEPYSYGSNSNKRFMLSDLADLAGDEHYVGKHRGLYVDILGIRQSVTDLRDAARSLSRKHGDFFDKRVSALDTFLDGKFLREVDELRGQVAEEMEKKHSEQIAQRMRSSYNVSRDDEMPGLAEDITSVQELIRADGVSAYQSSILDCLDGTLEASHLSGKEADTLRKIRALVRVRIAKGESWYKHNLFGTKDVDGKVVPGSAVDRLFKSATAQKQEFESLAQAMESMAFVYDMAEFAGAIPPDFRPENILWTPAKSGFELSRAIHPYALLRIVLANGRPLSDLTESELKWTQIYDPSTSWPPQDYETRRKAESREYLRQAFEMQMPVDIGVSQELPFAVVVGRNGAGKTWGLEVLAQNTGCTVTTGLNLFAHREQVSNTSVVRALINASRHKQNVSSYQGEMKLLAALLKDTKGKPPGELSLAIFDEVGRGTDSRDGLALTIAVMEYCRRHNMHLAVASHHGRRMMELAKILKLDGLIQLYTPDAQTHELLKVKESVPSGGIEVMAQRAKEQGLSEGIINPILENARRIRSVHDSRTEVNLLGYSVPTSADGAFPFVTDVDLRDIGMSATSRDNSEMNDQGLLIASKMVWQRREGIFYFQGRRLPSLGREDIKYAETKAVKAWTDAFETRLVDQSLTYDRKMRRKTDIAQLVAKAKQDRQVASDVLHAATDAFVGFQTLAPFDVKSTEFVNFSRDVGSLLSEESPIGEWFSIPDAFEDHLRSFTTIMGTKAARTGYFKSVRQLAEYFEGTESVDMKNIAVGLRRYAQREQEMDDFFAQADAGKSLSYRKAIGSYVIKKVDYRLISFYRDHKADLDREIGRVFSSEEDFMRYLTQQVKEGDLSGLMAVRGVLARIPSTNYYDTNTDLRKYVDCFGNIRGVIEKGLRARALLDSANTRLKAVGKTGGSASEIAAMVEQDMIAGSYDTYEDMMAVLSMNTKDIAFYDEPAREINRFRQILEYQKWIAFEEAEGAKPKPDFPTGKDYYGVLGVAADVDAARLQRAYRKLQKQYHPDTLYLEALDEVLGIARDMDSGARARLIQELQKDKVKYAAAEVRAKTLKDARSKDAEAKTKEIGDAWEVIGDPDKRKIYDTVYVDHALNQAAFLLTTANTIDALDMVQPTYSDDGSLEIKDGVSLHLVDSLGKDNVIPQSLKISADTAATIIGGPNGGGKSHLLLTIADIVEWADCTGFVPAKSAVLPKTKFVFSAVNAGESIMGKSSFQREIDRYLDLLKRYTSAGCPENGIIFLDEPLASTSSEDQTGILVSLIDFFRSRNVKVVITNHNHATYDLLRRAKPAEGRAMKFSPVAFSADRTRKFRLDYYDAARTDEIRSQGLDIALEMGVEPEIVKIARHVRTIIDRMEERRNGNGVKVS